MRRIFGTVALVAALIVGLVATALPSTADPIDPVDGAPTTLIAPDVTGVAGGVVELRAYLETTEDHQAISGETVTFTVHDALPGGNDTEVSGVTGPDGWASATFTPSRVTTTPWAAVATYHGGFDLANTSTGFTVSVNQAQTSLSTITSSSPAIFVGAPVTYESTLTRSAAPSGPLASRSVSFVARDEGGTVVGQVSATTDGSGLASATFTFAAAGPASVTAEFSGDDILGDAQRHADVLVYQRVSLVAQVAHGVAGDPVSLSAGLSAVPGGTPIVGATLHFAIGDGSGTQLTGTTGADGIATVTHTPAQSGTFPVTVTYTDDLVVAADGTQGPVMASTTETATPVATALSAPVVPGPVEAGSSLSVASTLSRLTVPQGPMTGRPVTAYLDDHVQQQDLTTDAAGRAVATFTPSTAGTHTVTFEYAGTVAEQPASTSTSFSVVPVAPPVKAATALAYTGDASVRQGATVHLAAKLTSAGGPLAGRTVTFAFGSATCSATTAADGTASCNLANVAGPTGSRPVTASYAGDATTLSTSSTATVTVTAPPGLLGSLLGGLFGGLLGLFGLFG